MQQKTIFVVALVLVIPTTVFAVRVPPFVTDPNAPQPTVKPPGTGPNTPWDWAGNKEPIGLNPGEHLWIGVYNNYDPNRSKSLDIWLKGDPNISLESVSGYEPNGSTVSGTVLINQYGKGSPSTWFYYIRFEIQPEWEMIKIKNNGTSYDLISNIEVCYTCNNRSTVENRTDFSECSIGHSDHQGQITQMLLAHETASINTLVSPTLVVSDPCETWAYSYVTSDPCTGEAFLQGAWLWTCTDGNGIAAAEKFDTSMATEQCLMPGLCMMRVYDSNSDLLTDLYLDTGEPQPNIADINRDCTINFADFGLFVDNWLDEY
ncbi:MAG: hypothetical protein ACYSSI_06200 [Planctomycetota bacterium]|jgi:hypothetical protein